MASFRDRQRQARAQFGTADTRPQDENKHLKIMQRRLNFGLQEITHPVDYNNRIDAAHLQFRAKGALTIPAQFDYQILFQSGAQTEVTTEERFNKMMSDIAVNNVVAIDYEFHSEETFGNGMYS